MVSTCIGPARVFLIAIAGAELDLRLRLMEQDGQGVAFEMDSQVCSLPWWLEIAGCELGHHRKVFCGFILCPK